MKKLLALLLVFSLATISIGCGSKTEAKKDGSKPADSKPADSKMN